MKDHTRQTATNRRVHKSLSAGLLIWFLQTAVQNQTFRLCLCVRDQEGERILSYFLVYPICFSIVTIFHDTITERSVF